MDKESKKFKEKVSEMENELRSQKALLEDSERVSEMLKQVLHCTLTLTRSGYAG